MTTILESLSFIARKAGNLLTELQGQRLDETLKGPGDLLTRADLASHAFLQSELANCFPGLSLILEEQANTIIPDTACIVGDELDGTIPFARGMRDWGVLLARIEGLPTHGVIFLPAWNLLIAAERSKGCWVNGETVRLSAPVAFNEIVFGTELNPRLTDEHRRRIIDPLSSKTLTTRCLACGAAGFAELILGRTSLYVNCKGGRIWDFAAGALAVEEAGGVVRRLNGAGIDWRCIDMDILCASSTAIAEEALRLTAG
ncbi:MAG: inositol monophosphatase family protein [Gammaproteobacteria bacterium]|nr:inositol monophosphatase family protein [Gammaproteobacteria bacterium]